MQSLNRSLLPVGSSPSSARAPGVAARRVLQFGDGNFLRAFADWMFDLANDAGVTALSVSLAAARGPGAVPQLAAQEGLFTVVTRGLQNGQAIDQRHVVRCVDELIDPSREWSAVLDCARRPELRFVVSNTTEAGIAYVDEGLIVDQCPASFPAKLCAALWARYQQFGDSAGHGLIVLPCELLENNGGKLRRIVLQHAANWGLPAGFARWVEQHNHFLNTLVDRIVPGYPASEIDVLQADLGYVDGMMVAAEPFHLWVIEGPAVLEQELPLARAGLNVVWTDNLHAHRASKVRVLNGAHTASALAAYGAGLDTVKAMTDDALFARYLKALVFDEIVPFVPLPEARRQSYAATILERFANPHIRHELISIALNSVSKWQVRVLPTIKDYAALHGRTPPLLSFSLAALLAFYRGRISATGEYLGERQGKPYAIKDNPDVIAVLGEAWRGWEAERDAAALSRSVLGDARLWGEDLNALPGLTEQVAAALSRIQSAGVRSALGSLF